MRCSDRKTPTGTGAECWCSRARLYSPAMRWTVTGSAFQSCLSLQRGRMLFTNQELDLTSCTDKAGALSHQNWGKQTRY
ncbi:hypothetical protein LEMLEM_LOCUS10685 [Lemmus lemmus]